MVRPRFFDGYTSYEQATFVAEVTFADSIFMGAAWF